MSDNHTQIYHPRIRQPQTLGELETWMIAKDATSFDVPTPVRLNPPSIPGVDRLSAYCHANYGSPLSFENVRRLIGTFAIDAGLSIELAKAAPFPTVADLLAPMPPAKNDDLHFMKLAVEQARKSVNEDGRLHPKVVQWLLRTGNCSLVHIEESLEMESMLNTPR